MTTQTTARPIKALVVQDSPGSRLTRILERDGDIAVIGQPTNGAAAIGLVAREHPDIVILDLQLSDGSGQHVIEQIMAQTPTPILVLSSSRSPSAAKALLAGALDALALPSCWTAELESQIRRKVRQIRHVPVIRHPSGALPRTPGRRAEPRGEQQPVVALAASTGGPRVLATILSGLGGLRAPVLVVQHLHPDFTRGLFDWLARESALPVEIAEHDQPVLPGHVYLAPGAAHLRLAAKLRLELAATPATLHRPSADQLFLSVAEHAGSGGVGVLLTGMGDDGARGLLEIHGQRGRTFGQDEASCAVFGMPSAAQRLGAVTDLLPPHQMATAIRRAVAEILV
jgi:two-component system, chemotaxis family, protein-glutamate methylesterase/glutaminase